MHLAYRCPDTAAAMRSVRIPAVREMPDRSDVDDHELDLMNPATWWCDDNADKLERIRLALYKLQVSV